MFARLRQFRYHGYASWLQLAVISNAMSYNKDSAVWWTAFAVLWLCLVTSILAITGDSRLQRVLGAVALLFVCVGLFDFFFVMFTPKATGNI